MNVSTRPLLYVLVLAMLIIPVTMAAQTPVALTIEQQKTILFDSIREVLRDSDPEIAQGVRLLAVGSWWQGTAGPGSDLDITLAYGGPPSELPRRIEKDLVERIEQRIETRSRGRLHNIKVIRNRDPHFDELFRGETGQDFIYDYTRQQRSCIYFRYYERRDGTRVLGRYRTTTDRFFTDTGQAIPNIIRRPEAFVEDSWLMLHHALREGEMDALQRALKAAKYRNNVDTWLVNGLRNSYGVDSLPGIPAQTTADELQLLVRIKQERIDAAEARAMLRRLYDVADDAALDRRLNAFVDGTQRHLTVMRDKVEFVDFLHCRGSLARVDDLGRAVDLRDRLFAVMTNAGLAAAGVALDVYSIIDRYYTDGPQAALGETFMTLISYGQPQAAIAAVLADVGRTMVESGITLAGNYFIFDDLNADLLQRIYDPNSRCGIFNWEHSPLDGSGNNSKLRGLSRETLYYFFPKDSVEDASSLLAAAARRYVDEAKSWGCGWFAAAGAGDLTPVLHNQLVRDWQTSRDIAMQVMKREAWLLAGERRAARSPLTVLVNGDTDEAIEFAADTVGEALPIEIEAVREFDMVRNKIPVLTPGLYDYWGRNGWASTAMIIRGEIDSYREQFGEFDRGYGEPLSLSLRITGAGGWQLDGQWPVTLPDLSSGAGTASAEFDWTGDGFAQYLHKNASLMVVPTKEARKPITMTFTFALPGVESTAPVAKTVTVRVRPPRIPVVITPTAARVEAGGVQTFTATAPVQWTVQEPEGGRIDEKGRYRAPDTWGEFHVVATSLDDAENYDTAVVTVTKKTQPKRPDTPPVTDDLTLLGWGPLISAIAPVTGRQGKYFTEPPADDLRHGYRYALNEKGTRKYREWSRLVEQGTYEVSQGGKRAPYAVYHRAGCGPSFDATGKDYPDSDGLFPVAHRQFDTLFKKERLAKNPTFKKVAIGDLAIVRSKGKRATCTVWRGPFELNFHVREEYDGPTYYETRNPVKTFTAPNRELTAAATALARDVMREFDRWYDAPVYDGPGLKGLYHPFAMERYLPTEGELPQGITIRGTGDEEVLLIKEATVDGVTWNYEFRVYMRHRGLRWEDKRCDAPIETARGVYRSDVDTYYATLSGNPQATKVTPREETDLAGADEATEYLWNPVRYSLRHSVGGHGLIARRGNVVLSVYGSYRATVAHGKLRFTMNPIPEVRMLAEEILRRMVEDAY